MSNKISITSPFKDKKKFKEIPDLRKGVIEQAPETPVQGNFAVNSIANFLHTPDQYLKVKRVTDVSKDVKLFVLEPDTARGTAKLAYFKAGQSINITVTSGTRTLSEVFSLCSSPSASVDDEYFLIIKYNPDNFVINYIFNNWEKGVQVDASSPFGEFTYQTLRDSKNVVAICDNVGFHPILSMAEAIADGTLNINLTVLYSARKQNETVMADRFDILAENCNKINVVYIFSDEHIYKCERGFITKTLIEKYTPTSRYSVFISCSPERYINLSHQISELRLERKYIRINPLCKKLKPTQHRDYPRDRMGSLFLCKVIRDGEIVATVPCTADETLLKTIEKDGIEPRSQCRNGECGFCRAILVDGDIFTPKDTDERRIADKDFGIIHPCCSYPLSNLIIELQ